MNDGEKILWKWITANGAGPYAPPTFNPTKVEKFFKAYGCVPYVLKAIRMRGLWLRKKYRGTSLNAQTACCEVAEMMKL